MIDDRRYNLAGEYLRGREEHPSLSLDEYVSLVDQFGKCALTLDREPPRIHLVD